jgi:conjugal transfer pilus assembly protein TraF
MIKQLIIVGLLGISISALAGIEQPDSPMGLLWYNTLEQQQADELTPPKRVENSATSIAHLSYQQKMAIFRKAVNEALNKSLITHDPKDYARYIELQNLASANASKWTWGMQKAYLDHPELDYRVQHPTEQSASNIARAERLKKQIAAVKFYAKDYGLMFFYRGQNKIDQQESVIVQRFAKKYGMSLLGISMDRTVLKSIQQNKVNQGQAQKLGIKTVPALVLYNAKTKVVKPVLYGFATQDKILTRLYALFNQYQNLE